MITNDIQELLDGTLSDERMAEMLHTLSVSPEKRAAFRQHMALRGTMERDRTASALTPAEDAVIWGGIASAVQAPVTAPAGAAAATGLAGWMGRAAALVIVGVTGYLLGSNNTTNIFSDGTAQPTVALSTTTPQEHSASPVAVPTPRTMTEPAVVSAPTVENSGKTYSQLPSRSNKDFVNTPPEDPVQATRHSSSAVSNVPQNVVPETDASDKTSVSQVEEQTTASSMPAELLQPEPLTPPARQPDPALRQHPQQPAELMKPPVASLYASGLEVAFGERVGRVTPTPYGIDDADPDFSNRSLDVSYRIPTTLFGANSSVGFGGRATYGTFSTVTLEAKPVSDIGIVTFAPKLEARKGWAFEGFINYRQPLFDWLALGIEGSFTGSSTYQKAGGDIFILGFVTERIGIQAGVGYAQYWYNLRNQREQLFRDNPDAAVTSDASDSYQGGMLQGRYGLFYRF